MNKKKHRKVTPGEFVNRLRDDIFAHTRSDRVSVELDLNLNASLHLCSRAAQQLRLHIVLERGLEANKRE